MRPTNLLSVLVLVPLLGACGADPVDGGEPEADAPAAGGDDAAAGADAGASGERSIAFDLDPSTITISGGQVPVFQLVNIQLGGGLTLTGGNHYHVYLDTTDGRYLIYSAAVPSSPDIEVDADTPAGTHSIIVEVQDGDHEPIGVSAERPLEVLVE